MLCIIYVCIYNICKRIYYFLNRLTYMSPSSNLGFWNNVASIDLILLESMSWKLRLDFGFLYIIIYSCPSDFKNYIYIYI